MKLTDYLEAKVLDVTQLKDVSNYTIIVFDLETNGLIGSQGLKLTTGKYYDEKEKRMRNTYSEDNLHIAEIGAISYTFATKKRGKFHTYIKANLDKSAGDKTIKELISWSDFKEANAKNIRSELISFEAWLKRFDKKIIVAHNGKAFDFKVMKLIAEKFNLSYLKDTFSENNDHNTILVDTKLTGAIRKELVTLPWPTGTDKDGNIFSINNQNTLIKMFGINNGMAHTAIADVTALAKYLIKIGKRLKK